MRVIRYGAPGEERFGAVDDGGVARDAAALLSDVNPEDLPAVLGRLGRANVRDLPALSPDVRLGCPVARVGKVVAVGLNYRDHAAEAGMTLPEEPVLFMKANTSVSGPNDSILVPPEWHKVDWEVELGVVIGRHARRVRLNEALEHIAGYVVVHDVSERAHQLEHAGQWTKGKSFDTFCPVGPWLVTREEIPDPQQLRMHLDVNGRRMQAGSTASMIFGVEVLVEYISRFMTLEPGDLIATGTPAGVGLGKKPPLFLKDGDLVELGIERLGSQRQWVRVLQ
jgi:2,4-didehydro-3-deoxy-L-rhamnonate hydrolase